tara:strand:- start:150 stop:740 length:591 start_codon:yes stop_codon:yes gene_type:complete
MRTYLVNTAATTYPVTLAETKLHLKVDVNTDDNLISSLIVAATQISEEYTNRFFINTELTMTCTDWSDLSSLLKSNVVFDYQTNTIKYYAPNDSNNLTTLSNSTYNVLSEYEPAQVEIRENFSYPDIQKRNDAINITYTAGYGTAANVPNAIKQSILLTIGNWYSNRSSVVIGRIATELPQSAKWLLDTYKVQVLR